MKMKRVRIDQCCSYQRDVHKKICHNLACGVRKPNVRKHCSIKKDRALEGVGRDEVG